MNDEILKDQDEYQMMKAIYLLAKQDFFQVDGELPLATSLQDIWRWRDTWQSILQSHGWTVDQWQEAWDLDDKQNEEQS